ncbi:MAG TPA: hypothetical protein PKC43_06180 [Phycisphaerales bacterium]|nr:hypothetical protein [Phycisphaerales bacterium]HMP37019.1 hypothetical protein [Phycisphaerales bacterium]
MGEFRSRRADGRGHRVAGDRTHAALRVDGLSPPEIVAMVVSRLDDLGYGSRRRLARQLRVTPKQLWRWLSGHDWPSAAACRRLLAWVRRERPWTDERRSGPRGSGPVRGRMTIAAAAELHGVAASTVARHAARLGVGIRAASGRGRRPPLLLTPGEVRMVVGQIRKREEA